MSEKELAKQIIDQLPEYTIIIEKLAEKFIVKL